MNLLQMRARAERAGIAIDGKMWKVMLRRPAQAVAAIRAVLKDYLGVRRPAPTTGRSGAALTRARTTTRTKKGAMAAMNLRSIERRISKLEGRSRDDAPAPDAAFARRMAWEAGLPSAVDPAALRQVHAIVHRAAHAHEIDGRDLQSGSEFDRQVAQLAASAGISFEQARREFMKRRGSR